VDLVRERYTAAHYPGRLRSKFLELVAEQLKVRDIDVHDAIRRAINYLQPVA
jgi:hypothetical protein